MAMANASRDRGRLAPLPSRERGPVAARGRVLVVDDDDDARRPLEDLLRADGFATRGASNGEAALSEARRELPDLVITDLQMPGLHGTDLCRRLHEIDSALPVIVMTAHADTQSAVESLRAGASDYLSKPLQYEEVVWRLERALAQRATWVEKERLEKYTAELSRALNERLVLSSLREQEHAEAEAQRRAELNALIENMNDGVIIAEPGGRISMLNASACAVLGLGDEKPRTVEALYALELRELGGEPIPSERRPLMRALRGEQFVDDEALTTRPTGEQRRVLSAGTNVRDRDGKVALAIIVFRDVTDLRRLEQQREEYLALISHDLRNPLNSIMIMVSTLKRSLEKNGLREEADLAERTKQNVWRMNTMIEELTEATTLDAHGVTLRRVVCDLRELVGNVVGRMEDARAERIAIETDSASPYSVLADPPRLERVLANLLTNALKYSPEGAAVRVALARQGSDVTLAVSDRGIGIAPESVKMLFGKYYRTGAGMARASGLGLGLYIARLIAEAHDGRIDVSSEAGKGSTFTLTLPSHAG